MIELKSDRKRDPSINKEQVDFLLTLESEGVCCIDYVTRAAKAIVLEINPLHRGDLCRVGD